MPEADANIVPNGETTTMEVKNEDFVSRRKWMKM